MNLETFVNEDLWKAIRHNIETRNFTGAIQDSMYYLSEIIRQKSNLDGDGVNLISEAFNVNKPLIKISKMQTETEKNQQRGFDSLCRGMYMFIRNPRSHEKFNDSEADCRSVIVFIDYIARQIDGAKSQVSIEDIMDKILDKHFVDSYDYANLIIDEMPKKQIYDLFVVLVRARDQWHGGIRHILQAILHRLNGEQANDFHKHLSDVISQEDASGILRMVRNVDAGIINNITKASKLRMENIIIKSIKMGESTGYDSKSCNQDGVLATWCGHLFGNFLMKNQLVDAIILSIESKNTNRHKYVINYILPHIYKLEAECIEKIAKSALLMMQNGYEDFYFYFKKNLSIKKHSGDLLTTLAIAAFKKVYPSDPGEDIPF